MLSTWWKATIKDNHQSFLVKASDKDDAMNEAIDYMDKQCFPEFAHEDALTVELA